MTTKTHRNIDPATQWDLVSAGCKIKFAEDVKPYTIRACSRRYLICTKPYNPQRTVLYTIVDVERNIRGPENLIFGLGAETDRKCWEMLVRLLDGKSEVSYRKSVQLNIEWIHTK